MTKQNCVFCNIIEGKLSSTIIAQNDTVFVIQDIRPKAPVHYLVMPKEHLVAMSSYDPHNKQHQEIARALFAMVAQLAQTLPPSAGFNLVSNNGEGAGQEVPHLHWHFLSEYRGKIL